MIVRIQTFNAWRDSESRAAWLEYLQSEPTLTLAECSDCRTMEMWISDYLRPMIESLRPGDTFACADLSRLSNDEWRAFLQVVRNHAPRPLDWQTIAPHMADGAVYTRPDRR